MKMRSARTLKTYGITEADFTALYNAQDGRCAICGISESELESKYSAPSDWPSDRVLHIDHEHGSSPTRVRGLLCAQCNFDLEAYIRNHSVIHPGGRGKSFPRSDPRFVQYLGASSKPKRPARTARKAVAERHDPSADFRSPSEVTDEFWVWAYCSNYQCDAREAKEQSGKWLIFVSSADLDEVWAKVRDATLSGELSPAAKAATARENSRARHGKHVICVYTYDGGKHATLVRDRLRTLGFVAKLGWKADEQTYAGEYATRGGPPVAKRFE